jgi:hypothetical protein
MSLCWMSRRPFGDNWRKNTWKLGELLSVSTCDGDLQTLMISANADSAKNYFNFCSTLAFRIETMKKKLRHLVSRIAKCGATTLRTTTFSKMTLTKYRIKILLSLSESGKSYWGRRISTVDLLVLTSLDPLLFMLKILFYLSIKTLMRRLIVLSLLPQLVFPNSALTKFGIMDSAQWYFALCHAIQHYHILNYVPSV